MCLAKWLNQPTVAGFGMWHGLPAREDTAKMAVPRKNFSQAKHILAIRCRAVTKSYSSISASARKPMLRPFSLHIKTATFDAS